MNKTMSLGELKHLFKCKWAAVLGGVQNRACTIYMK